MEVGNGGLDVDIDADEGGPWGEKRSDWRVVGSQARMRRWKEENMLCARGDAIVRVLRGTVCCRRLVRVSRLD